MVYMCIRLVQICMENFFFRSMRHVDRTVHFDLKTQFDNFFFVKKYLGVAHTYQNYTWEWSTLQ